MASKSRNSMRKRRHLRVRKKVNGTAVVPRLNVYRSLNEIYVQAIDDDAGNTIASASTLEKSLSKELKGQSKTEQARVIGTAIADRVKVLGIKKVVFDRGGYRYHGRVKALAEAAREAGLQF
ncbi:MAG: 50S ribosomal protein L18 [Anaerolineales bacterium]|nr:50S ribosomal protein L18 [Anaerolineales bacterium]